MPNDFGGDHAVPDHSPYLDKSEDDQSEAPAVADPVYRKAHFPLGGAPMADAIDTDAVDKRVRSIVGDYRVVVPDGRQKGSKFYVNNSPVVIERRGRDARGVEKWDCVTSLAKPGPKGNDMEINRALYWLLAGPDAE